MLFSRVQQPHLAQIHLIKTLQQLLKNRHPKLTVNMLH